MLHGRPKPKLVGTVAPMKWDVRNECCTKDNGQIRWDELLYWLMNYFLGSVWIATIPFQALCGNLQPAQ